MFAAVRRLSNPGLASRPSCPPELHLSSVFDPKRSHVGRQHRKVEAKPRLVRAVARNAGSFEAAAEKLTPPTGPPARAGRAGSFAAGYATRRETVGSSFSSTRKLIFPLTRYIVILSFSTTHSAFLIHNDLMPRRVFDASLIASWHA